MAFCGITAVCLRHNAFKSHLQQHKSLKQLSCPPQQDKQSLIREGDKIEMLLQLLATMLLWAV